MASNADNSVKVGRGLPTPPNASTSGRSLWLWVAAGFLFLALLWSAMFIAARQADTRTVPLETKDLRK